MDLDRPLPHAEGLPAVTRRRVSVSQRNDGGHEVGLGAERVAEAGDGGLNLALREKRPPELVLDAGQHRLFRAPFAGAQRDDPLLRAQRPLPLPLGHAEIAQGAERRHVVVVVGQQALEQGRGFLGAARPPEVLRRCQHELGPLLASERVQVVDQGAFGVAALERQLAQPRVRLRVVGIPRQQLLVDLDRRVGAAGQLGVDSTVVDVVEGLGAPGLARALVVAVRAPEVADEAEDQAPAPRRRGTRRRPARPAGTSQAQSARDGDADARGVQRGEVRDDGAETESEEDAEADGHGLGSAPGRRYPAAVRSSSSMSRWQSMQ